MEKCKHEAYLKRLVQLNQELKIAQGEKQKELLNFILGYLEALEQF